MSDHPPPTNELAALIGPVWSATKVCASLRITVDELASKQEAGEILALITSDGATVYPVFQFWRRHRQVEVNSALAPMLQTLRGFDGWAVAVLVHTPAPELNGMTPLDWTRQEHEAQAISHLASAVAREWRAGAT